MSDTATRSKKLAVAPGITTSSKKLLVTKGIATSSNKLLDPMFNNPFWNRTRGSTTGTCTHASQGTSGAAAALTARGWRRCLPCLSTAWDTCSEDQRGQRRKRRGDLFALLTERRCFRESDILIWLVTHPTGLRLIELQLTVGRSSDKQKVTAHGPMGCQWKVSDLFWYCRVFGFYCCLQTWVDLNSFEHNFWSGMERDHPSSLWSSQYFWIFLASTCNDHSYGRTNRKQQQISSTDV